MDLVEHDVLENRINLTHCQFSKTCFWTLHDLLIGMQLRYIALYANGGQKLKKILILGILTVVEETAVSRKTPGVGEKKAPAFISSEKHKTMRGLNGRPNEQ